MIIPMRIGFMISHSWRFGRILRFRLTSFNLTQWSCYKALFNLRLKWYVTKAFIKVSCENLRKSLYFKLTKYLLVNRNKWFDVNLIHIKRFTNKYIHLTSSCIHFVVMICSHEMNSNQIPLCSLCNLSSIMFPLSTAHPTDTIKFRK